MNLKILKEFLTEQIIPSDHLKPTEKFQFIGTVTDETIYEAILHEGTIGFYLLENPLRKYSFFPHVWVRHLK